MMHQFDVVMPIKASDLVIAEKSFDYINKNIGPRNIVIITAIENANLSYKPDNVKLIDENCLLDGLDFKAVKEYLARIGGPVSSTGWYFQQFLKLGYSRICKDKYYLVWDADTIPLNKLEFIKEEKILFNLKREYVPAYFVTMKSLLDLEKQCDESFITEHMLFEIETCKELLRTIENNEKLKGSCFWEKMLSAVDFKISNYGFSEYELYGSYMINKHPEKIQTRKLRTFRIGVDFLGANPSKEALDWVAKDFDTISFEKWGRQLFLAKLLCDSSKMMAKYSFTDTVQLICKIMDFMASIYLLTPNKAKALTARRSFDYFFGSETEYELKNK